MRTLTLLWCSYLYHTCLWACWTLLDNHKNLWKNTEQVLTLSQVQAIYHIIVIFTIYLCQITFIKPKHWNIIFSSTSSLCLSSFTHYRQYLYFIWSLLYQVCLFLTYTHCVLMFFTKQWARARESGQAEIIYWSMSCKHWKWPKHHSVNSTLVVTSTLFAFCAPHWNSPQLWPNICDTDLFLYCSWWEDNVVVGRGHWR